MAKKRPDKVFASPMKSLIQAKTQKQKEALRLMGEKDIVFLVGLPGTGKTLLATKYAVESVLTKRYEKIVIARPAVTNEESIGFLPGELKEKLDPFLMPIYDQARKLVGSLSHIEQKLEVVAFGYLKGRSLENSIIIIDEAEDASPRQMKNLLTRLGEGSKMIITGDLSQVDARKSGLREALEICSNIPEIGIVEFNDETDVLRHPLIKRIIKGYEVSEGLKKGIN